MQLDAGLRILNPCTRPDQAAGPCADKSGDGPHECRRVHHRRQKVNKVDELFEGLMALIDSAQGMPHDPADNKLLVDQAVADNGKVLQQQVVG